MKKISATETKTVNKKVTVQFQGSKCHKCQFQAGHRCTLYQEDLVGRYVSERCVKCKKENKAKDPVCVCGKLGTMQLTHYNDEAYLCEDCLERYLKGEPWIITTE